MTLSSLFRISSPSSFIKSPYLIIAFHFGKLWTSIIIKAPSKVSLIPTAKPSNEQSPRSFGFLSRSFSTTQLPASIDIIVSNPPYVRNIEKLEIKKNVLNYEPHLALFVEDTDALLFYRKIAQLALKSLSPKGLLFFEINQYLGKETVELLQNLGFKNIELKKDMFGNDRMVKSEK